jgi:hypothetical protein
MIFKEDTKNKNKNRKQNNPKPQKRCRDYENLTCGKKGRPTHLLSLWKNLGGRALSSQTQAATTPQKDTETANRRQREPPAPNTDASLSLPSLCSEGNPGASGSGIDPWTWGLESGSHNQ